MTDEPNLIHRDDLDMEVVEGVTAKLQEMFPGMKVVFAGDEPDIPEDVKRAALEIEAHMHKTLMEGQCTDCGKQMPNFPPDSDDWEPAEGWCCFSGPDGEIAAWQCPECDVAEDDQ